MTPTSHALAGGRRRLAGGGPAGRCADQPEVRVVRGGPVDALVLGASHQRGLPDGREARAVEPDRHRVEREVVALDDLGLGRGLVEPRLEVVAQGRQLGPVGLRRGARVIDLLAVGGLRLGRRREGRPLELDERVRLGDRGRGRGRGVGLGGRAGRDRRCDDEGGGQCRREREPDATHDGVLLLETAARAALPRSPSPAALGPPYRIAQIQGYRRLRVCGACGNRCRTSPAHIETPPGRGRGASLLRRVGARAGRR